MSTLHMEPEQVRETAANLRQWLLDLEEARLMLQRMAGRLAVSWQAGSRSERYHQQFQTWLKTYRRQLHELESLSQRLSREVDEWELADRSLGRDRRSLTDRLKRSIDRLDPRTWSPFVIWGVFAPIAGKVEGGIARLYDTGMRTYRSTREFMAQVGETARRAADRAVRASDKAMDLALSSLLKGDSPDSSETMAFKIEGDVTIPGTPGKLVGAGEGSLTRNKDGTYTLKLGGEAGVAADVDLVEAKAKVRIGQEKYGVGVDVSAEAAATRNVEVAFTFDPNRPGDMTKMAAFMSSLGLAAHPGGAALVGPALYTLKDNLSGLSVGSGVEGGVNASAHALVELAAVDVSVSAGTGISLEKVNGQWEAANYLELGGEVHGSLLTVDGGLEAKTTLESVRNLNTGGESARVTVEVTGQAGRSLDLSMQDSPDYTALSKYLPEGVDLESINLKASESHGLVLEYTLEQPAESVRQLIQGQDGQPDWRAIADNSSLEIKQTTSTETGLGAEAEVGLAGPSVGLGLEGTVTRSSEHVVYSSK